MERVREHPTSSAGLLGIIAVVGAGLWWFNDKGEAVDNNCTNATQQLVQVGAVDGPWVGTKNTVRSFVETVSFGFLVNDSRTLSSVAKNLSDTRGYYVSTERLAAANKDAEFIRFDEDGKLIQDMPVERSTDGTFCVSVPPPIYGGYELVRDGESSLATIAAYDLVSVDTLHALNPALSSMPNDTPLSKGTTVKVSEAVDTSVVYRQMTPEDKNINTLAGGDTTKRNELLMANAAIVASGSGVNSGSFAYLPMEQTDFLKEKSLSTDTILASYDPANVALDTNFITEAPVLAAAAKEIAHNGNIAASKVTLSPEVSAIVSSLSIDGDKKSFLNQISQAAIQLQRENAPVNLQVMLAQAILESGGGSSALAHQYNNLFGMKVGDGWSGPTIDMETLEQNASGASHTENAVWRVYSSTEESMHDYAMNFIGKKNFYQDAVAHKDDVNLYIAGLLNQLNPDGSIAIAQGQDGAMSYATDVHYAEKIKSVIDTYKLNEIVAAINATAQAPIPVPETAPVSPEVTHNAPTLAELKAKYGGVSGQLDASELEVIGEPWGGMQLNAKAAEAFRQMNTAYAAAHNGANIEMTGTYRTLQRQKELKREKGGLAATPGKSNHGWGMAMDLTAGTYDWDWLNVNGPAYGWSNPNWARKGGSGPYEPWHIEYNDGTSPM